MATSLPRTWAAIIDNASHCVGFTLPGMIDEPGSLSGINISPIPLRGPDDNMRISFAIFIRLTADRKSTRLNSSHVKISYAVFCLKKNKAPVHRGLLRTVVERRRQIGRADV